MKQLKKFGQWKKVIIFAVVLVLLIGVLIVNAIIGKDPGTETDPTPTPGISPVVDADDEDVVSVTLENAEGKLVFKSYIEDSEPIDQSSTSEENELVWKLETPAGIPYSESTLKSKVSGFLSIDPSADVADNVTDLSEYGLEEPSAKVTLKFRSGSETVVLYGNEVVGGSAYYIMTEGSGHVYTVSSYKAENAFISYLDLIDNDIFGGLTSENINDLSFKRSKDSLVLEAFASTDPDGEGEEVATWNVTSPIEAEASYDGFYSLLNEIVSISPVEFKELHPEDLSVFGLDEPLYELQLGSESKDVELLLGGDAGGGMLYGYTDHIDAVFTVDMSALAYIDKPATELISSFAYMISIWEVTNIDIVIGQEEINCEIEDDQEKDIPSDFKVNGQDANVEDSSGSSYFRSFYQSVISVFVEGLDLEAMPEYREDITITYTLKEDGTKVKLTFTQRDEYSYYCFKDGEYLGYYVSSDDFFSERSGNEGILPAFRILENAMDKQVDGVYQ